MKRYTIIGAGTAGWLTALYVKQECPSDDVTVVASSEIGILGAGEGTTPIFIDFLKSIDVPVSDIIKHTKGTIKNNIKFTNWNGDGKHFYHTFEGPLINSLGEDVIDLSNYQFQKISEGDCFNDVQLATTTSEQNKVQYKKENLHKIGNDALHFDANLLAKYLQTIGLERGINLIDDEVVNIKVDDNDYITGFELKSGSHVAADYVFDCSGFKRLIIGKFYKSNWNSYKEHLPMNRAMPFFLQNDTKEIPPYTESIAMKYGWMWKIPIQGRFGCGYVFDSNYATDEEIKQELKEYLGHEIVSPRMFSFDPGCYDDVCVKNCVALGLSASFVEPLEATSILSTILMLKCWGDFKDSLINRDDIQIKILNQVSRRINSDILNFIQFHYLTKRTDSEFWKMFRNKNKPTPFLENLNDFCKNDLPTQGVLDYLDALETSRIDSTINFHGLFNYCSWLQVGSGINYFNKDHAKKYVDEKHLNLNLQNLFEKTNETLMDHYEFLEKTKNA